METPNKPTYSHSLIMRIFFSVLIFCFSLTILFLMMRLVLSIGGFCAEGGPYEIAAHCPKGIIPLAAFAPLTMIASIFVYLSAVGVTGVFLFWSAIFLSLGWNFLEFAVYPPKGEQIVVAWLISGIMFVLMGIGPFIYIVKASLRGFSGGLNGQPGARQLDVRLIFLHLIGVALGVGGGITLFNFFTS